MRNRDGQTRQLRFYKILILCIFIIAQVFLVAMDLYYLFSRKDTVASFFLDWSITTVLLVALLASAYFLLRREFVRYRESEEKYRELADSLPEILFEVTADGIITYTNKKGYESFGYSPEQVERGELSAFQMIAEQDLERAVGNFRTVLEQGPVGQNEYMAKRADGTTFPVILSSSPILRDGRPVGLRGVLTDITERKTYEEELARVNAELDGYAHTVSHDLKNPLHRTIFALETIKRLLELPRSDETTETMTDTIEVAQGGAAMANRLTDDLLMLAESGQVPKDAYPVDINEKVGEILAEKARDITLKGITVEVDDDLGRVVASETQMYQLFVNVIKNAIDYNDSDRPVIEIRHCESGGGHRYFVRDNGSGIPTDILDEVFMPFRTGAGGDTGIGLSIAEKIVKVYKGEIRAYNDGGACFEFTVYDLAPRAD